MGWWRKEIRRRGGWEMSQGRRPSYPGCPVAAAAAAVASDPLMDRGERVLIFFFLQQFGKDSTRGEEIIFFPGGMARFGGGLAGV
jgi:hypothetical protein